MSEPENETEDPADIEVAARANGWVPEGEWKSEKPPPGGFLTAEEFEKRGHEIRPIMAARLKKQDEEMAALRAELGGVRQAAQKFEQFSQQAIERERAENKRAIEQLEARRAQAITDGDGQTAVAAERQIKQLEQPPVQAQPPPQMDPAVAERWVADNAWYGTDKRMRAWAEGRSKELLRQGTPPGEAVLNAIAAEARQEWPEVFGAAPPRPSGVEGYGRRSPPRMGRVFDDLPADAKQEFETFKKLGVNMTKQSYAEKYFEGEP